MNKAANNIIPLLRTKIIENAQSPYSECWIWRKSRAGTGYGDFKIFGEHWNAHRAAYVAFVGPIPEGMHVLHRCDVRLCCNPDHLFLGTNKDNIVDSMSKGRRKGVARNRPSGLVYKLLERKCVRCSKPYMGNAKAMYCCDYCRVAAARLRKRENRSS